jgi:hypothetical protein
MFKVGDKVTVKRHKCNFEMIGPFETTIEYIDKMDDLAEVTDPQDRDWCVRLSKLIPKGDEKK